MESPRFLPALPQITMRPRCIMKPVNEPVSPPTMMVPPFWSMPVRAPTEPLQTRSPPRMRRAELRAGILLDEDGAGQHVLAAGPADAALDPDIRPVEQAAGEIAAGALDIEIEPVEDADARSNAWSPDSCSTIVP